MAHPLNHSDGASKPTNASDSTSLGTNNSSLRFGTTAKLATAAIVVISAGLLVPLYLAKPKATAEASKTVINPLKAASTSPVSLLKRSATTSPKTALSKPIPVLSPTQMEAAKEAVGLGFNPGLYTIGAFGIATVMVSASAFGGFMALQYSTGATTLSEFSIYMKRFVHERLPKLEEKLFRPADDPSPHETNVAHSSWSWTEAERRLSDAYDKGGFMAWASQAFEELESERKAVKSDVVEVYASGATLNSK
ncbi:hypothetical protein FRC03_004119 [Tulasnella sp. 419]|nr:hypothetical protein FRC02_008162 [Tulasnella sp. 418]KAG8970737.1 hypothetical protein FRC03_004119 [Tulasnella sp. 419]